MSFTHLTGVNASNSGGVNVTTANINTTGADLIAVLNGQYYGFGHTLGLSDSKGNTWTNRSVYRQTTRTFEVRWSYCVPTSVGSGHTFTVTGFSPLAVVLVFSGANATPFDVDNGAGNLVGVNLQFGSVTPSVDDCVVLSGMYYNGTAEALSSPSGYTAQGTNTGIGWAAYKIQTTAGAENPTWSFTGPFGGYAAGSNIVFKPAGGGGGTTWPGYISPFGWKRNKSNWKRSIGGLFIPPQVSLV